MFRKIEVARRDQTPNQERPLEPTDVIDKCHLQSTVALLNMFTGSPFSRAATC